MDKRRHTILRFACIYIVVVMLFCCVVGQIIKLQRFENKKWIDIGRQYEPKIDTIRPMRGNILDSEGRLLAGSLPRYNLIWDTRTPALHSGKDSAFINNVDAIAEGLADILGDKSASEYKRSLYNAFNDKSWRYNLCGRRISFLEKQAIMQLPLLNRGKYKSGVLVEESYQRSNPFGTLAKRTIGNIYGATGRGTSGIEKRYEEELAGTPGLKRASSKYEIELEPPTNGCDVVTTIDANLQDLVESTLHERLVRTGGEWGCCILMEVATGEIKAIANLDITSSGTYQEIHNHAALRVEPGSTFKTTTLMALLDEGRVDFNNLHVVAEREGWTFRSIPIHDSHHYMRDTLLDVRGALAVSSNIALAKMLTEGYKEDPKPFVAKLNDMGMCDEGTDEIPGSQSPLITTPPETDRATIAKMAYGYFVELTPLQTTTFYNAIANNGRMVSPVLVKEIRQGGKTKEVRKTHVIRKQICRQKTLEQIRACLHDVVWSANGTASRGRWSRKAQSDLVAIAGKTGTAQIREKGYNQYIHRISFVGYFPEENPKYTCMCVISGVRHPFNDSGAECGSVVRIIAEHTMAMKGTIDASQITEPRYTLTPAIKGGQTDKVFRAAKEMKIPLPKKPSEAWVAVNDTLGVRGLEMTDEQLSKVRGMGARDAIYAIERWGWKVKVNGQGKVRSANVETINGKKVVTLELR